MWTKGLLVILTVLYLTGCATIGKETSASDFQKQISNLEQRIKQQDDDIQTLRYDLERTNEDLRSKNVSQVYVARESRGNVVARKTNGSAKQIQSALKNAGYYEGKIDGKIGPQSKRAIKEFQRDNGLKVDGVVGKKTWTILNQFLEVK